MHGEHPNGQEFPVRLSILQRRLIAGLTPELADYLRLDEPSQRVIPLERAEWIAICGKIEAKISRNAFDMRSRSLRQALELIQTVIAEGTRHDGYIPHTARLYQFRITLKDSTPVIWRRIQVKNCTLDKLHEHIQTVMGWTNSHLHQFRINGHLYGDPMLLNELFEEMNYRDSTSLAIRAVVPRGGARLEFEYEYDFGDSWLHEVLFEGWLRARPGSRYPVCIEGERACPPEDCGGVTGYAEFLEALADAENEDGPRLLEWAGGHFDPDAFDAAKATRRMRRGLPNWRLFDDVDLAERSSE